MAALLWFFLWSFLAFVATGVLAASIPGSALVPTARSFGYDGTALVDLRLRQSAGQDNCGKLRPSGRIQGSALLRGGFLSHPAVKFTGKERDGETGLDYFGARYMSSAQGRFTSPDPHNIIMEASSEDEFTSFLSNPQNWNRYAYVTNNPLSITDPDGRCPWCPLFERLSPYADKALTAAQRYGSQAVQAGQAYGRAGYLWATSFFSSPTGQQAIQTTAELATGTVIPGSPIAGVSTQTASRILTALGSSDAAKQMEGKVAQSLANSELLKAFDVTVAGRQIDAIAGKAGQFVVEVTTGGGRGKIGQALAQMKDTGKQLVIYGEDLSKGFVREARKQGIKVAQNLEELKKIVGGQ